MTLQFPYCSAALSGQSIGIDRIYWDFAVTLSSADD